MEEQKYDAAKQEQGAEGEPRVYPVQKGLTGWRFSRRGFLAAAGAAAAATGASLACGSSTPEPVEEVVTVVGREPTKVVVATEAVVTEPPPPTATPEPELSPEERLTACLDVKAHAGAISALKTNPDGTLLVSGVWTKEGEEAEPIKLWSLPDGALIKTLEAANVPLMISSLGTFLVAESEEGVLGLWSLPEGELVKTFDGTFPVAFSPDETLLILEGEGNSFDLWSLPDGELITTLEGHLDEVRRLVFSPDGTLLISGGEEGTIRLWSLPEGEFATCLMDLAANESGVEGVSYEVELPSGQTVEYTLPCGAPIPAGAVCVCNCVAGSYTPPCSCVGHTCSCVGYVAPGGHYWYPC